MKRMALLLGLLSIYAQADSAVCGHYYADQLGKIKVHQIVDSRSLLTTPIYYQISEGAKADSLKNNGCYCVQGNVQSDSNRKGEQFKLISLTNVRKVEISECEPEVPMEIL